MTSIVRPQPSLLRWGGTLALGLALVLAGCGGDDDPSGEEPVPTPDGDTPIAGTPDDVIAALNAEGDALLVPELEFDFWGDASDLPASVNYGVFCEREAEILTATFEALPTDLDDPALASAYQRLRSARLAYTDEQRRVCEEVVAGEQDMPVEVLDGLLAGLDVERDSMTLSCVDALESFAPHGVLNCSREPIVTSAPADFVLDLPPPEILERAGITP